METQYLNFTLRDLNLVQNFLKVDELIGWIQSLP
jgi:hypothetical protein